jgi:hypothetical protein
MKNAEKTLKRITLKWILKKPNLKRIQLSRCGPVLALTNTVLSFGDHARFFVSSATVIFAIRTLLHKGGSPCTLLKHLIRM